MSTDNLNVSCTNNSTKNLCLDNVSFNGTTTKPDDRLLDHYILSGHNSELITTQSSGICKLCNINQLIGDRTIIGGCIELDFYEPLLDSTEILINHGCNKRHHGFNNSQGYLSEYLEHIAKNYSEIITKNPGKLFNPIIISIDANQMAGGYTRGRFSTKDELSKIEYASIWFDITNKVFSKYEHLRPLMDLNDTDIFNETPTDSNLKIPLIVTPNTKMKHVYNKILFRWNYGSEGKELYDIFTKEFPIEYKRRVKDFTVHYHYNTKVEIKTNVDSNNLYYSFINIMKSYSSSKINAFIEKNYGISSGIKMDYLCDSDKFLCKGDKITFSDSVNLEVNDKETALKNALVDKFFIKNKYPFFKLIRSYPEYHIGSTSTNNSDNYPHWALEMLCGFQMVALNMQRADPIMYSYYEFFLNDSFIKIPDRIRNYFRNKYIELRLLNIQPSSPESSPSSPESSPTSLELSPSSPESSPSLPESSPSLPESSPSLPESSPSSPESSPSLPESSPSLPESSPSLPESSPSLPESSPSLPSSPESSPTSPEITQLGGNKVDKLSSMLFGNDFNKLFSNYKPLKIDVLQIGSETGKTILTQTYNFYNPFGKIINKNNNYVHFMDDDFKIFNILCLEATINKKKYIGTINLSNYDKSKIYIVNLYPSSNLFIYDDNYKTKRTKCEYNDEYFIISLNISTPSVGGKRISVNKRKRTVNKRKRTVNKRKRTVNKRKRTVNKRQ